MKNNEFFDQIQRNKTNFTKYNQIRLKKFKDYITGQKLNDVVDAITVLICINYPDLPGYVEGYDPISIYNFTPSANALMLLQKHFPTTRPDSLLKNTKPIIELLAIMGSAGSIAYNDESDIDYWVCFDQNLISRNSLMQLKIKLSAIEAWAAEKYNLETHFFLNDITRIKNSVFDSDEDDISGKALGKLLKDEFFRTSIILHGKIPFWWAVPAGTTDESYEKYLKAVKESDLKNDFIDLGNLHLVNKDEFLGAGIFQILKSLGNPFKSILKIGILEKYLLEESKNNILLCNILKEKIHKGIFDVNFIDPYILMFNMVVEYYSAKADDPMVIELLRRCFYIKIDPNLSAVSPDAATEYLPEKITIMQEYTKKWNWLAIKLKQMDDFRDWEISVLNKFWNNISKLILKTYKNILSSIGSSKISQKFSNEEMRYISRKITSSFATGGNKISPAVSFNDNPVEKFLFIESISQDDGSISWLLSKGFLSGSGSSKRSIVHKEPNLLAILAWIGINRLYQNNLTRVDIKSRYHLLEQGYVRELLNDLALHFSRKKVNIKNKYFFTDPFPILNFVIINLFSKYPKGIEDIYYLTHNSWGENIYEKYTSELDFSVILTKLLNGAIEHKQDFKDCVALTSPYPYKASKEFKLILYLFNDTYNFFMNDEPGSEGKITKKYITTLGGNYVLFSYVRVKRENKITCSIFNNELKMLYSLSGLQGIKNIIKVNQMNPELNHLKIISDNFKDDAIQIYFQKARKYCYFFVSDERGSLIFFRKNADVFQDYLTRLYVFSKNVITQVMKNNPSSAFNRKESKGIEIYRLERNDLNQCKIAEINPALDENIFRQEKKIVPLKLSLLLLDSGEIGYRFNLPDGGISDNLSKTEISGIAKEIKILMETSKDYNYYISDINYSNLDLKLYKDYSTFSFVEKNRFELLIEKGLGY